jgi:GDP-D-mannose dehydratase
VRFYQASNRRCSGVAPPQGLSTPFRPIALRLREGGTFHQAVNYREAHGFMLQRDLVQPRARRGETFVREDHAGWAHRTGLQHTLTGNWTHNEIGDAKDYVRAMAHAQQDDPGDYVVATGDSHGPRVSRNPFPGLVFRSRSTYASIHTTFGRRKSMSCVVIRPRQTPSGGHQSFRFVRWSTR